MRYTHYEVTDKNYINWIFKGKSGNSVGIIFDLICNICSKTYITCKHNRYAKYKDKECNPEIVNLELDHVAMVEKPRVKGAGVIKIFIPISLMNKNDARKYGRKKVSRPEFGNEIQTENMITSTQMRLPYKLKKN